jgi:hypothetical protein
MLGACCKHKNDVNIVDVTTLIKSDFPIKVGNIWRYMRGDDLTDGYDTIVFSILSAVGNDSFYAETYNVNRQEKVDSGYVVFNEQTFSYETSNNDYNSCFASFKIDLPCQLHGSWAGNCGYDSLTYVATLPETAFFGKHYFNSHKLLQKGATGGSTKAIHSNLNFKKGIGLITYSTTLTGYSSFGSGCVLYLLDYKLKD